MCRQAWMDVTCPLTGSALSSLVWSEVLKVCDTKGKIRSESSFKGRHSPFWPQCLDLLLLQISLSEREQWEQPWAQHSALARLRKSIWSFGFCWQSNCEAGWGALKHLPRSCGWPPVLFLGTHFLWSGSRGRWAQRSAGSVCLWCLETPDRAVIPHRGGLVTQSWTTLSDPMNCSLWVSSVPGFSRQEYWSGLPCPPSGDLPDPRVKSASSGEAHHGTDQSAGWCCLPNGFGFGFVIVFFFELYAAKSWQEHSLVIFAANDVLLFWAGPHT